MLPKQHRLSTQDVQRIDKGSPKYSGRLCSFIVKKGLSGPAKAGIIASKKMFPKAVVRTAIRRKLYEALDYCGFREKEGAYILILTRPALENASLLDVVKDIEQIFSKLG